MNSKTPPGPKGHFLLGSVAEFKKDSLGFIEDCSRKYGGIVKTRMANRHFYFITDADLIHEVLTRHNHKYIKSFIYRGMEDFLGKGLLNNEGEYWVRQRKLIQPCFHRKELAILADLMLNATNEFLGKWEDKEGTFPMQQEITKLTNSIITASIFGKEAQDHMNITKMFEVFNDLKEHANQKMVRPFMLPDYFPTAENRRYHKSKAYLHDTITKIIEERRKSGKIVDDLLGQLLRLQFEDGEKLTNQELYNEIVTLFVAGQETSTSALTFLFYLLTQNKRVYDKLMLEIDEVFENDQSVDFESLMKLKYLSLVIKETLRLYSPAWAVSRECIEEDNLGGYTIPKGAVVLTAIYYVHRDPRFWEKPDDFIPERFEKDYITKAYIPFGSGPRTCIGNHFALQEMQIATALILRNFKLELVSRPDFKLITPITLNTKDPLFFKREQREKIKKPAIV